MSGTGALSVRYPFERNVREENRLLVTQDQSEDLSAALAACAKGDRKALRHIYDSEAGRLVAVAQRILRRRDLAEEAVQEGFIRIWTKAHQFEPGRGSARGWIYAVIRNHALNMLRDGKREDLVTSDKLEELQDREQIDQIMASWQRLESGSRLHECLGALEETRRRTILMAYVGGYTHGEIAGRLRLPLGTAKSWIKRGLSALRECMR
ncbi:sigma-70 family RNA polymerase sigma factor [Rhizobium sp. CG4]|nr:sigma-70 family RNA polymerase sigma factor [Rhizobium sp. CG4]